MENMEKRMPDMENLPHKENEPMSKVASIRGVASYRKNMLLKKEKEGKEELYRVLEVTEELLVVSVHKRSMPIWKSLEEMDSYEEWNGPLLEDKELSPKQEQEANRIYNIISPIIPFIANEVLRTASIKEIAKRYDVSEQFVRKYLSIYLAYQDIKALAPKIRNENRPLTPFEKNIRKALNKWYYTTKKRTLKNCYTLMLKEYYCDEGGKLFDTYPSYDQFIYFYRKNNKTSTEMISRNTLSYYQRNQRPLVGGKVQGFAGTIGMGMLDATVCDIYLINDGGELIGRPILTFCVDAYSGVIMGYSLAWEGGIYSLRDLMLGVLADKRALCKSFGISIEDEQWPSSGCIPLKLVTDQGSEYKGYNFEQITDLGVELINLQAYRAEQKGPVEKSFDVIQGYMAPYLKGKGYVEPDFQERGAHDYRKDACLTLKEFEKILLHCIVFYNSSRVLEDFPMTEEMLEDEIKPIPCYIWNWAKENIGQNLLPMDKEKLMRILLPRVEGQFTRKGLKVNGLLYHNPLYREQYLDGKLCTIAYDPDMTNVIWLIENGAYIPFDLIEDRFKGMDLDKVKVLKGRQRGLVKEERKRRTQAEIDLAKDIGLIVEQAQMKGLDAPSIHNIRANREKEQSITHKVLTKEAGING